MVILSRGVEDNGFKKPIQLMSHSQLLHCTIELTKNDFTSGPKILPKEVCGFGGVGWGGRVGQLFYVTPSLWPMHVKMKKRKLDLVFCQTKL